MSIKERIEYGNALRLLAQHGMVAVTEERLQRLKAVVEAAREVVRHPYLDEIEHLAGTLKALEEDV